MCRKLWIAAVAVVVGLFVLKKTELGSLIQVWWNEARVSLEKQVPPEVRIKQLRLEIAKIDQDILKAVNALARQERDYENLRDDVAQIQKDQKERLTNLKEMVEALETRATQVVFHGTKQSADDLQVKLDTTRQTYENKKEELKVKEELLGNKKQMLEAADKRIRKLKAQKEQLLVLVSKLETRLELVRLKQVENKVDVSNSQVSKCQALGKKIDEDLREKEKQAELYQRYGLTTAPAQAENSRSREDVLKAARKALEEEKGDGVAQK